MCWNRRPALFPSRKNGGKARNRLPQLAVARVAQVKAEVSQSESPEPMRMRAPFLTPAAMTLAAMTLVACGQSVPDSGAGVGFQDYNSYLREQEAAAARAASLVDPVALDPVTGLPMGAPPAGSGFSTDIAAAAINRATGTTTGTAPGTAPGTALANSPLTAAPLTATSGLAPMAPAQSMSVYDPNAPLDPNRPRGNEPTTIAGTTSEMTGIAGGGISDEQDFNAVSSRETIESDKERIARNRAQYTVIQPTAVPERAANTGPNLVEYALSTTHNPGMQMYSRSSIRLTDPNVACARFTSSDFAQQAFLEAGGPQRDRKGLDPDGDGFACAWDPRPFRLQ
jgi:hypothetical protein